VDEVVGEEEDVELQEVAEEEESRLMVQEEKIRR
jgi:hypothetical protein